MEIHYSTSRALEEAKTKLEKDTETEENILSEIGYYNAVIGSIVSGDNTSELAEDDTYKRKQKLNKLERELRDVRKRKEEWQKDIDYLSKQKTTFHPPPDTSNTSNKKAAEEDDPPEKSWFAQVKTGLENEQHVLKLAQILEKYIKPTKSNDSRIYREMATKLSGILRMYEKRGKLKRIEIDGKWAYGLLEWWNSNDELDEKYLPK